MLSDRAGDARGRLRAAHTRTGGDAARGSTPRTVTLFLSGDVMLGRGVDQVLSSSCDPRLHERHVSSAERYVELAERKSGPIPAPVEPAYVWGDALRFLEDESPDARIVNLETAVTTSDDRWRGKGIHYRMHPANVDVLTAAGIDCCVLANNHVLDWGRGGLEETLRTLRGAGLATAGAGPDAAEAACPAALEVACPAALEMDAPGREAAAGGPRTESRARDAGRAADDPIEGEPGGGRVLVFALGSTTAGIPRDWGATGTRPGVNLLADLSEPTARAVAARIRESAGRDDLVVVSIHWGGNWGYRIPPPQRRFAHLLIEEGGVDLVHGHSSHHPKAIEVHRGRPILYGCGDLLNDYEGIAGHEAYRGDLALLYFVTLRMADGASAVGAGRGARDDPDGRGYRDDPDGRGARDERGGRDGPAPRLEGVRIVPMQIRRFRLRHPSTEDRRWLAETMDRECRELGGHVDLTGDGRLELGWDAGA